MPLDKLTGAERNAFTEALLSAFPNREELERMVSAQLEENLEQLVADGSLIDVAFRLVQWAESRGKQADLLDAALTANSNPQLQKLDALLRGEPGLGPQFRSPTRQITPPPGVWNGEQRFGSVPLDSVAAWYERLRAAALTVCRIELYNAVTTGFLVGPDIVLTQYAAIREMRGGTKTTEKSLPPPTSFPLRFGFTETDLTQINPSAATQPASVPLPSLGQTYYLEENWLVDADEASGCALLRVRGMPGLDPFIDSSGKRRQRRWLRPAPLYIFSRQEPLFLLSYPSGGTLTVTYANEVRLTARGNRVEYRASTFPGAGGAPCLTHDLQFVAVHQGQVAHSLNSNAKTVSKARRFGTPVHRLVQRPQLLAALFEESPV